MGLHQHEVVIAPRSGDNGGIDGNPSADQDSFVEYTAILPLLGPRTFPFLPGTLGTQIQWGLSPNPLSFFKLPRFVGFYPILPTISIITTILSSSSIKSILSI